MTDFKIVISDPKTRKSYQKDVEQHQSHLVGKKIGDNFKGDSVGLAGYELQITGGSDKDGFPMRVDVEGATRKRLLVSSGVGFHPKKAGERRRKSIRGNTVSPATAQINTKVVIAYGPAPLEKLMGKTEKAEEKEEKKSE